MTSHATLFTHLVKERKPICQSSKLSRMSWSRSSSVISAPRMLLGTDVSVSRRTEKKCCKGAGRDETTTARHGTGRRLCLALAEHSSAKEPSTGAHSHPIQDHSPPANPPAETPLIIMLAHKPSETAGGGLKATPTVAQRCSSAHVKILVPRRSGPEILLRSLLEEDETTVNEPCRVWNEIQPVEKHVSTMQKGLKQAHLNL